MSLSNHPIIIPSDSDIEDAFSSTNAPDYFPATPRNTSPDSSNDLTKYLLATLEISPKDTETSESPTPVSLSSSVGSSSPVRMPPKRTSTSEAPAMTQAAIKKVVADSVFAALEAPMPPKRTSTSEAPAMTQAAIKKLVANSVFAALEAQAANMANTDNTCSKEVHLQGVYELPIFLLQWYEKSCWSHSLV
nr:hypothetical protein [Tanacetum cinerariifolium]